MWFSSTLKNPRLKHFVFATALALGVAPLQTALAQQGTAEAAVLSTAAAAALPNAKKMGEATMRWFGLKLYDCQLWSEKAPGQFNFKTDKHYLELVYARNFDGEKIAEKSREEIENQGVGKSAQLDQWQKKLTEIIPNVNKGTRLAALYVPGKGMSLLKDGLPVGEVSDPELASAFMGIWLDPKTSEPVLREKLIGLKK
ncbi:MAG: chalcone isomerase family protein [Burkholderiales bacterium]|jgi:hypothetical protein|nr:chalcone isomerase family protein [Burkholderiales bacterium]